MKLADKLWKYMWFGYIMLMSGIIVIVIAIPEAIYPKTLFSNYNHYHVILIVLSLVVIGHGINYFRKNEVDEVD